MFPDEEKIGFTVAGYLFAFSDLESLENCIKLGLYSPIMSQSWSPSAYSTLADLVTMKKGDDAYFFSKRMIYGIAKIREIEENTIVAENHTVHTCCTCEESDASPAEIMQVAGFDSVPDGKIQRWVISFEPNSRIFKQGIDMDDLLASNPFAFRSLRVFWKRTFIKLDDEENLAFKAALIRKNRNIISSDGDSGSYFSCDISETLNLLKESEVEIRQPNIEDIIKCRRNNDGSLSSEAILELGMLHQLAINSPSTERAFGRWDYITHQLAASPMKAVDYMDRLDVFGYSWVEGYEGQIIDKYYVCELKKGALGSEDVSQIMKYVDWVCDEYANGDYSMVEAFLVGNSIAETDYDDLSRIIVRQYITGRRPLTNNSWGQLSLVSYNAQDNGEIDFETKYCFSEEKVH